MLLQTVVIDAPSNAQDCFDKVRGEVEYWYGRSQTDRTELARACSRQFMQQSQRQLERMHAAWYEVTHIQGSEWLVIRKQDNDDSYRQKVISPESDAKRVMDAAIVFGNWERL